MGTMRRRSFICPPMPLDPLSTPTAVFLSWIAPLGRLVSTSIISTDKGGRFRTWRKHQNTSMACWPSRGLPNSRRPDGLACLITLYIHLHIFLSIPICLTFSLIFICIICPSPISIPLGPLLLPLSSFNPFLCYFHLVHLFRSFSLL